MRAIFGELIQDQPAHMNEGLLIADGCFAIKNGYNPLNGFSPAPNGTLAGPALGSGAYRVGLSTYVFAATAGNIYRYQSGGFTSLIGSLSSSQSIGVRFQPYNNLMLATNGTDPIKVFDPASPTTMTSLGGTPPTARFMAIVRGFVVLGYAAGDSLRLAWCDNGAPTTWTAGTGEAGFYEMPSGGDITGVIGGEYGLIFQESRILRMTYTADDTIWQFDEIANDIGCVAPNSIAVYGKSVFFLSNRGLMVCDGTSVRPVGAEKVDRTFLAQANRSNYSAMSAVVDPRNSLYIVALPSANPPASVYIYNFLLERWTTATVTVQLLFNSMAQSVTLEDLDALYGTLEGVPVSLDDPAFRGGTPLLMLFDGSNRLGSLSGSTLRATFLDAVREPFTDQRARVKSVRLLSDAPSATVTLRGANVLSETQTPTSYTVRDRQGRYRMRENWTFVQTNVEIPSGTSWNYMQGIDMDAQQGGRA